MKVDDYIYMALGKVGKNFYKKRPCRAARHGKIHMDKIFQDYKL
jgi:hypothetical protein